MSAPFARGDHRNEDNDAMVRKTEPKPKLTDAERHARFIETARDVEASEDPKDFERAFGRLVEKALPPKRGG